MNVGIVSKISSLNVGIAFAVSYAFGIFSCSSADDPPPGSTIQPTLASIQTEVFNRSCTSPSCHGSNAGGLNLTSGNAYNQLVNAQSIGDGAHNPPLLRVKPGKPDSSFLIIKLTAPGTTQGTIMPQVGGKLSDDKINAIRRWIANGAQP